MSALKAMVNPPTLSMLFPRDPNLTTFLPLPIFKVPVISFMFIRFPGPLTMSTFPITLVRFGRTGSLSVASKLPISVVMPFKSDALRLRSISRYDSPTLSCTKIFVHGRISLYPMATVERFLPSTSTLNLSDNSFGLESFFFKSLLRRSTFPFSP